METNKTKAYENNNSVYQFDKLMKELSTSLVKETPTSSTTNTNGSIKASSSNNVVLFNCEPSQDVTRFDSFNTGSNNIIELKKIANGSHQQQHHDLISIQNSNQTNGSNCQVEMEWNDQEFIQLCQELDETDSLYMKAAQKPLNPGFLTPASNNIIVNNSNNSNGSQNSAQTNVNTNLFNQMNEKPETNNNSVGQSALNGLKHLQNQQVVFINNNVNHSGNNNVKTNAFAFELNHNQMNGSNNNQVYVTNSNGMHQFASNMMGDNKNDPLIRGIGPGQPTMIANNGQGVGGGLMNGNNNGANNANNSAIFYIDGSNNSNDTNILTLPWDFENDFNTLAGYLQSPTI
jgi:hypothetical protein